MKKVDILSRSIQIIPKAINKEACDVRAQPIW